MTSRAVPSPRLGIPAQRLAALLVLSTSLGIVLAFLIARGEAAGSDALAYWNAVHLWLAGGDPYHVPAPALPYVYAPWLLPIFLPWAALPWPVAWFIWRGAMFVLFGWSVAWAYRRRPGWTALLVTILAGPLAATLDTGNVTLFLALGIWAAQFIGPRLGGAIWAISTGMKWLPLVLWPILPPATRRWGLVALAIAVLLSIATWPQTLVQITVAAASGPPNFPRPLRIDHAVLIWAAVPWLWQGDLRGRLEAALRWRPSIDLRRALSGGVLGAGDAPES